MACDVNFELIPIRCKTLIYYSTILYAFIMNVIFFLYIISIFIIKDGIVEYNILVPLHLHSTCQKHKYLIPLRALFPVRLLKIQRSCQTQFAADSFYGCLSFFCFFHSTHNHKIPICFSSFRLNATNYTTSPLPPRGSNSASPKEKRTTQHSTPSKPRLPE